MILVTGGCGFIGSNFIRQRLTETGSPLTKLVNLDALTYAGNLANLKSLAQDARHIFVQGDIGDRPLVDKLLKEHQPRAIVHFAAESLVDRSIHGPGAFVQTNVVGTLAQQPLLTTEVRQTSQRHDRYQEIDPGLDRGRQCGGIYPETHSE